MHPISEFFTREKLFTGHGLHIDNNRMGSMGLAQVMHSKVSLSPKKIYSNSEVYTSNGKQLMVIRLSKDLTRLTNVPVVGEFNRARTTHQIKEWTVTKQVLNSFRIFAKETVGARIHVK